jgi:hypothetical protein
VEGLRPLGLGELLDAAMRIYRDRWKVLLASVAVPVVPVVLFSALVTWSAQPDTAIDPLTGTPSFEVGDAAVTLAATLVSTLALLVATSVATAACFRSISGAYLGDAPTWQESLRFGLRRVWAVLGTTILATLAMLFGLLLCIAPGVWAYTVFAFAIPALLVEETGVLRSLGRSRELVRGSFWRVLGILVVATIIALLFQSLVSAPLIALVFTDTPALVQQVVNVAVQSVATVLVTPFTAAITMALYIDLRVRKEGFDLVLWAQRLGADVSGGLPRQPGAPPPPPWGWGGPAPGGGQQLAPPASEWPQAPPPPPPPPPPPTSPPPPPARW